MLFTRMRPPRVALLPDNKDYTESLHITTFHLTIHAILKSWVLHSPLFSFRESPVGVLDSLS
jgi:hypothetical protein